MSDAVTMHGNSRSLTEEPIGYLESADLQSGARGWVCLPGRDVPGEVELLINGTVVGRGRGTITRPDLALHGLPFRRAGFVIPIPSDSLQPQQNFVEVRCGDVILDGGPIPVGPLYPPALRVAGLRDGMIALEVRGWPGSHYPAALVIDDLPPIEVDCTQPDVGQDESPLVGWAQVPAEAMDGQLHVVRATLSYGASRISTDPELLRLPEYRFNIDVVTAERIAGWAFRVDVARPIALAIERDGHRPIRSATGLARPDIGEAYGSAHRASGFDASFGPTRSIQNRFLLRDQDSGVVLTEVIIADGFETFRSGLRTRRLLAPGTAAMSALVTGFDAVRASNGLVTLKRPFPPAAISPTDRVTIVIPVYGGAAETAECIESFLAASNETTCRFVIIDDATPDRLISNYLDWLEQRQDDRLTILRRRSNGGFSEAANLGVAYAGRDDVILLNADTVVHDGWVDRLRRAAYSQPHVASVTPFTNNGEICSAPVMCAALAVDDPGLGAIADRVAATRNAGVTVELPVGVGFCLYLRREALDELGGFDAQEWGRGYGEEVDFCLKAGAQGWVHLLAADTYVVHRGSVSFREEKMERIRESARKIADKYPHYDRWIESFIARDPARAARRRLAAALIGETLPSVILHVSHDLGGGTRRYVTERMRKDRESGLSPVVFEFGATGSRLTLKLADDRRRFFGDELVLDFDAHETDAVMEAISDLRPERIHLHSPIGVPADVLRYILEAAPYRITVHDYVWLCPRVTLTRPGGEYCGEPEPDVCDACTAAHGPHPAAASLLHSFGPAREYRAKMLEIMEGAEDVIAGVHDVADRLRRHGLRNSVSVVPHHKVEPKFPIRCPVVTGRRIRVVHIGALSEEKGYWLFQKTAAYSAELGLPIEFYVAGPTQNDKLLSGLKNLTLMGVYQEEDLDSVVSSVAPDLAIFLSRCPETFSYTLSYAIRSGIYVIALGMGGIGERVAKLQMGGRVLQATADHVQICQAITSFHWSS